MPVAINWLSPNAYSGNSKNAASSRPSTGTTSAGPGRTGLDKDAFVLFYAMNDPIVELLKQI